MTHFHERILDKPCLPPDLEVISPFIEWDESEVDALYIWETAGAERSRESNPDITLEEEKLRLLEIAIAGHDAFRRAFHRLYQRICHELVSQAKTTQSPIKPLVVDGLTECQRDILEVIRASQSRLTTRGVCEALSLNQMIHGQSTVKLALSDLVKSNHLTNCQKCRPKGYGLAEWPPCEHAAH
jgi:hypothetical protein